MTEATDGHERFLRQFEEAFDNTNAARRDAETARDYYDGKQLTDEELEALRLRKQPPVISNRIKPKIDALLGFEKKQRTDPKAYPRTPKHEQEAESVTDAIRFVCDQNRFPQIRSEVAESMLIEGIGACTVTVVDKGGQAEVRLNAVPWDRFYYDSHSRRRDFSDANYLGVVLWMDEEDARTTYGGKDDVIAGCYASSDSEGETYDDRPKLQWADQKRKRIRVMQHRYREAGKWMQATLCKGGFLRDPAPSPFVDEDGVPECDLIAVSVYVDRENNRYGAVKGMISPQDEINKRRSKALHLLNTKQIITEEGAVADLEQARREAARPDGVMVVHPGMRFEVVEQSSLVQGQFELLQESKSEIDASGVNPAIEGDLKASSGRAQEMITQAGLAEQAIAFDCLKDWGLRVYRAIWHRIRQYWTEERWIRVTDDERNLRWVGVNQQVVDPMTGQMVTQNALGVLDVDLILEDGPDSITVQGEQFEKLVELKKADPMAIQTKHVIQASDLRNKDAILKDLEEGGIPPQVQQQMQEMQQALQQCQQELQQAQQQLAQAKMEKGVESKQVDAEIRVAQAELAQKEAELKAQAAEMKVQQAEFVVSQAAPEAAGSAPAPAKAQPQPHEAAMGYVAAEAAGKVMEKVQALLPAIEQADIAAQRMEAAAQAVVNAANAPKPDKHGTMVRQADGSYAFTVVER